MLRTAGKKRLHGEKYRAERVCVRAFVCMWESRRDRKSEESLLMVLFKSDLVAISAVTYCRDLVQSLSSSSELHTQSGFMLQEKTDNIKLFQMKNFSFLTKFLDFLQACYITRLPWSN